MRPPALAADETVRTSREPASIKCSSLERMGAAGLEQRAMMRHELAGIVIHRNDSMLRRERLNDM